MTDLHLCWWGWNSETGWYFPSSKDGPAVTSCDEDQDGALWVGSNVVYNRVNYCPFCGYKAKVQVEWKGEENG